MSSRAEKSLVALVVGIPIALIVVGAIGAASSKRKLRVSTLQKGEPEPDPGKPKIPFQRGR